MMIAGPRIEFSLRDSADDGVFKRHRLSPLVVVRGGRAMCRELLSNWQSCRVDQESATTLLLAGTVQYVLRHGSYNATHVRAGFGCSPRLPIFTRPRWIMPSMH